MTCGGRYYSSHWADGKTEAWKGDVTLPSWFCDRAVEFLTLGTGVPVSRTSASPLEAMCRPGTSPPVSASSCPPRSCHCFTSSLKSRAPSLSPALPPSLSRLPKKLIYFSKYKWTLSTKTDLSHMPFHSLFVNFIKQSTILWH